MDEKLDKKESELSENNTSVVAVRPKTEKTNPLYLIFLIVLIPGLIALGVIGYKRLTSGNGAEKEGTGGSQQTAIASVSDQFAASALDETKWTVEYGGTRSKLSIENGKLNLATTGSSFDEGGPESWVVMTNKQPLPSDYTIEANLTTDNFFGAPRVMFVLQSGTSLPVDYTGIVFEQGYLGTSVRAHRSMGNERVDLGTRLFEYGTVFKVKIVKAGSIMSFYVNDDLLGETGKFFIKDHVNFSVVEVSGEPDFAPVSASIDNISVFKK